MKQILWVDMDGVLADFDGHIEAELKRVPFYKERYKNNPDHIHGIFRDPQPVIGSVEAIHKLYNSGKYEMYIATAAPWQNPEAATDKRYWIEKHFGRIFHKRMAITHLKHMLVGDYLIDDRITNGAGDFGKLTGRGEHIHFGTEKFPNWNSVLNYLL